MVYFDSQKQETKEPELLNCPLELPAKKAANQAAFYHGACQKLSGIMATFSLKFLQFQFFRNRALVRMGSGGNLEFVYYLSKLSLLLQFIVPNYEIWYCSLNHTTNHQLNLEFLNRAL